MKKTAIATLVIVIAVVVWEFYGLSDPNDDVITFTEFFRLIPCWGKVVAFSTISALTAHFYWK